MSYGVYIYREETIKKFIEDYPKAKKIFLTQLEMKEFQHIVILIWSKKKI